LKVPEIEGVPDKVMVLAAQVAVTPVGRPVGVPIPVARTVVCEIVGIGELMQTVGVTDCEEAVLFGVTTNAPEILDV
jgi:hypothetical protein